MPQVKNELDIVVDLQYGDTGKGKITHALLSKDRKYDYVIRYNGGANAGHTIYHQGKKFVTHLLPAGLFYGVPSIVGPGCVINPEGFFEELSALEAEGIDVKGKIFIAENAHVVTDEHLAEDRKDKKIGTTGRGIGQAYRDKSARIGMRACEVAELKPYLVSMHDVIFGGGPQQFLAEGAQGFGLDIDWGDYPYVTSSHATTAGALLNGFPPQSVREVWGVIKAYETYVGRKEFEDKTNPVFEHIREAGQEFGATTGRPRQVNWLNTDMLRRGAYMNGVTHLVVNKVDIMREIDSWQVRNDQDEITTFGNEEEFCSHIESIARECGVKEVYFSDNPETI